MSLIATPNPRLDFPKAHFKTIVRSIGFSRKLDKSRLKAVLQTRADGFETGSSKPAYPNWPCRIEPLTC